MPISLGVSNIDTILEGGFLEGNIYHIFGEKGAGKSILALQCACQLAINDGKTLFFDMERTFTAIRLKQIAGPKFDEVSNKIFLHIPKNLKKFIKIIEGLESFLIQDVKLLIFDTITSLYQLEPGKNEKNFKVSKKFNQILAQIGKYAQDHSLITIFCNHVRASFGEEKGSFQPRARKIIKYWSNYDLRLDIPEKRSSRRILSKLDKNYSVRESNELRVTEQGFRD